MSEERNMIEIKDRYSGDVIYTATGAADVRAAVEAARREGADLREADLRGADLWRANLWRANLRGADLREADLGDADLRRANLRGADLRGADLREADLRDANLWGANLRDADLWGANLWGARWRGLQLNGLPSGAMLLVPQGEGVWRLTVGCWSGTVDELETLVAGEDWPEAEGEEQVLRRPGLEAVVALCRAHIAYTEAKSGKRGLDG